MIDTDVVTGLPTISADSVIEQIPLGQQVFPFQDLDAGARPRRQIIYGDDVIPTSALITGQDPNGTPRAATMTEDRLLKVSIANTSPIATSPAQSVGTNGFTTDGSGQQLAGIPFRKPKYLWSFLWFVQPNVAILGALIDAGFTWFIQSQPSGTNFGFAIGSMIIPTPAGSGSNLAIVENQWLANPIDVSVAFPNSDTHAQIGIATTFANLDAACGLVIGY